MSEDICPNCDEEFDAKTTFDDGRDFSISASGTLQKVCVFHVDGEQWAYLHVSPTVYVLEETPDGDAATLAPVGVFSDFENMNQFVNEEYEGDSSGLRWTEHDIDDLLVESDEASDALEAFACFLCSDPPDISDADEAIEHLVSEHDVEREEAKKQVEELVEAV